MVEQSISVAKRKDTAWTEEAVHFADGDDRVGEVKEGLVGVDDVECGGGVSEASDDVAVFEDEVRV